METQKAYKNKAKLMIYCIVKLIHGVVVGRENTNYLSLY